MIYSKRLGNLLLGKNKVPRETLPVSVTYSHPDGTKLTFPGNDGMIFALVRRLDQMQIEIDALKKNKK